MTMRLAAAVVAFGALAAPPAAALPLENPVLIVAADDVPLSEESLRKKLKHSLYWGGIRMVPADTFASLSANVAAALEHAGARTMQTVCAIGDSPCVTVILK